MVGVGAVGGLLPGRVGGQVAVGFGDEEPQALERLREIELVERGAELGDGALALARNADSAAVSAPASGKTPPKYLCTMLTTRLTRLP